ncbi:asparagine-linked glycosylation protein [Diaporthe australafricana]|uniref:GDP-Man:Man(3)GlcNAc(2)-PP-Dol alpha-1,2-mannosyltransferase n=1 Tax=Diaporthe australafricana TaxID=127596 RepID=A0ABR3Y506_9PEZI
MDGGASCKAPSGQDQWSPFGLSPTSVALLALPLGLIPFFVLFGIPALWQVLGSVGGTYLRNKTDGRRAQLLEVMAEDEKSYQSNGKTRDGPEEQVEKGKKDVWKKIEASIQGKLPKGDDSDKEWSGIIGFFHPFCNAGGGGERVLWAAIRATQKRWPNAKIVVYTGDHEASKEQILGRVKDRFNVHLHSPSIQFLYLSTRHWVLASTWPRMTLAGQSFGSLILAWDAFSLLVPDIFIDTMGYAFSLGLSKWLFKNVPTGAYVHYPTISTDMLDSLDPNHSLGSQGVNAGQGTGLRGTLKRRYWQIFAKIYAMMGATVDVVMTNSSWTQAHVTSIWGPGRREASKTEPIATVYPPCAVEELEEEVEVSAASEARREKNLLYIGQFRPEKNHPLVLEAFAQFVKGGSEASRGARLVLVGSVRDDQDSKRVYKLRLLLRELGVDGLVDFQLDASWTDILGWLGRSHVGVNGMWNEHFGIGVVEYQASGLICVVHDSGGPKLDIVKEVDGQPTGFHATTAAEFAAGFEKALTVENPLEMRLHARESAWRFSEGEFARKWIEQTAKLVNMTKH